MTSIRCVVPDTALRCNAVVRPMEMLGSGRAAKQIHGNSTIAAVVRSILIKNPACQSNPPRSPVPTVIQAPQPRLASQTVRKGAVSLPGTCGQNCPSKPLPREEHCWFSRTLRSPVFWDQGSCSRGRNIPSAQPAPCLLLAPCRRRPDSPVGHVPMIHHGGRGSGLRFFFASTQTFPGTSLADPALCLPRFVRVPS